MFGLNIGRMGSVGGVTMSDAQRIQALSGMAANWDFSDMATMYQDIAGTMPVTAVGQPVGLVLDKGKGLVRGPELWDRAQAYGMNATATLLPDGWTRIAATAAFAGLRLNVNPGTFRSDQLFSCMCEWRNNTSNRAMNVFVGGGTYRPADAVSGALSAFINPTASSQSIQFYLPSSVSGNSIEVRIASVREIPGAHLIQPTTTARPLYQSPPARAVFDGVDDALDATFPASLGSACTVVRSIPGTGASILTGQTIGTTYSNTTTSCGTLIFSRALTADETALVTRWANAKAGV